MKKGFIICFSIFMVLLFAACGSSSVSIAPMSSSASVASLSYISSGFIEGETELEEPTTYSPMVLSTFTYLDKPGTTTTKVEDEIGYVNIYLDKMKVFMNNGFNAFDVDEDMESDNDLYTFMMTYTAEGNLFTIYYNHDLEDNTYEGILITNEITYDLAIEDNLKEEDGESKRNLILTATNGNDWITIDYENKTEDGESKEHLEVTKFIDGVQSVVTIEIKEEEGSFKVSIQDGENSYVFKAETTDEGTHYKLNYTVDGIEGVAKIDETVDDDGNLVYSYKITEGDIESTIEKVPPGQDKDKNKDKDKD